MNTSFKELNQKNIINALKLLRMPLFIGFLKILREKDKTYFDDDVLEEELQKYFVLTEKIWIM